VSFQFQYVGYEQLMIADKSDTSSYKSRIFNYSVTRSALLGELSYPLSFALMALTKSAAVGKMADHTSLSEISVEHDDDGYSKRGNFGVRLCFNVFARWHQRHNVYLCMVLRVGEFEGIYKGMQ